MLISFEVKLVDVKTGDVTKTTSPSRNTPVVRTTHVEVCGITNSSSLYNDSIMVIYEPRDPEVKKEYEELLDLGMDYDEISCIL